MRLRLPELLDTRGMTAYALSQASDGRISLSAAYRLCRSKGHVRYFDSEMCEAICEVLAIEPGDLFEVESVKKGRAARKRDHA
jgi:DNA-binding Xre family transcriptional regulator